MKIFDLNPKRMGIRFAIITAVMAVLFFFTPVGAYLDGKDVANVDQVVVDYEYDDEYGVASTHFYATNAKNVVLGLTCYDGTHGIYLQRPMEEWEQSNTPRSVVVSTYMYENKYTRSGKYSTVDNVELELWSDRSLPNMIYNEGQGFGGGVPISFWNAQYALVGVMPAGDTSTPTNARGAPTFYRFEIDDKGRRLVKKYIDEEDC